MRTIQTSIGFTLGAMAGAAYACAAFTEEPELRDGLLKVARQLVALNEGKARHDTGIPIEELRKILREGSVTPKCKDAEALAWNGALLAVRRSAEEYLGVDHHESL